ncbi:MAG: DMT family transporter [Desulfobacteraceae bacterium]
MSGVDQSRTPKRGFVLLGLLSLLWGVNFPAMKLVLNEMSPWTFRAVCLSTAGLGLLLISLLSGQSISFPKQNLKTVIGAALFNITGWHLAAAYGISLMHSSRAVIIGYTMPVWASVLAVWFLNERLDARRVAGLLLGVAGLAFLLGPQITQVGESPLGVVFMLVAAGCWAMGSVLIKRGPWYMPMSAVTGWMFLIGGIPIFAGALIQDRWVDVLHLSPRGMAALVFVILLPTLFCHWAYYKVVTLFPVTLAAVGTLAIPVVGIVTSALLLKETLEWNEIVAMLLIVSALSLVLIHPGSRRS